MSAHSRTTGGRRACLKATQTGLSDESERGEAQVKSRWRGNAGAFAAALTASAGLGATLIAGAQQNQTPSAQRASGDRAPRNPAEYDEMFNKIKNWGRWGPTDERGAANLITDAKRKQAIGLVKLGTSVSLS